MIVTEWTKVCLDIRRLARDHGQGPHTREIAVKRHGENVAGIADMAMARRRYFNVK